NSDQNDQRLLLRIELANLLSFGPDSAPLELENLNILIGPNAAGKSNLIEALSLIRATPVSAASSNMDLRGVVRSGGGVNEWTWKGGKQELTSIDTVVNNPKGKQPLRHRLSFRGDEQGFRLEYERIENEVRKSLGDFYYRFKGGQPVSKTQGTRRMLVRINTEISILDQRRAPERYPEIAHLAEVYEKSGSIENGHSD